MGGGGLDSSVEFSTFFLLWTLPLVFFVQYCTDSCLHLLPISQYRLVPTLSIKRVSGFILWREQRPFCVYFRHQIFPALISFVWIQTVAKNLQKQLYLQYLQERSYKFARMEWKFGIKFKIRTLIYTLTEISHSRLEKGKVTELFCFL